MDAVGGDAMKLNIKALAIACCILWGGCVFLVALLNLACGYGQQFLELLASWYPGYHATRNFGEVILVTVYAAADGVIGGAIFGWLYNRFAKTSA
jgi:hypothetical protein